MNLRMTLSVIGKVRKNRRTDGMVYDTHEQIAYLTPMVTLNPRDIRATGTAAGVLAPTRNPLRIFDVVRAEIEGLGAIENTVLVES